MRLFRRRKTDSTQAAIIDGLNRCGYEVRVIHEPVDLAVGRDSWGNQWMFMECKPLTGKRNPKARIRADQKEQNEFCEKFKVPRVTSFSEAILAIKRWEAVNVRVNR